MIGIRESGPRRRRVPSRLRASRSAKAEAEDGRGEPHGHRENQAVPQRPRAPRRSPIAAPAAASASATRSVRPTGFRRRGAPPEAQQPADDGAGEGDGHGRRSASSRGTARGTPGSEGSEEIGRGQAAAGVDARVEHRDDGVHDEQASPGAPSRGSRRRRTRRRGPDGRAQVRDRRGGPGPPIATRRAPPRRRGGAPEPTSAATRPIPATAARARPRRRRPGPARARPVAAASARPTSRTSPRPAARPARRGRAPSRPIRTAPRPVHGAEREAQEPDGSPDGCRASATRAEVSAGAGRPAPSTA